MENDKIRSVRQITQNRHLNFYEMEAVSRSGKSFPYYMASRACHLEDLHVVANPYLGPATTAEEYWAGHARLTELLRPLGMAPELRMAPAFLAEAAGDPCILIDPFLSRVLGYDPAEA